VKLKTVKRFTTVFKTLQFSQSDADQREFLSLITTYDEHEQPVEALKFLEDGTLDERITYQWENNHLIVQRIEMPQEGMMEEMRYQRTPDGRLLKEQKFYGDQAGEYTSYTYHPDGNIASLISINVDGEKEREEQFEYQDGKLKFHHVYDGEGNLIVTEEIGYENNQRKWKKETDASGQMSRMTTYTYDYKGNLIRMETTDAAGQLVESLDVTFDERGNMIENAIRSFNSRTFRYQYDDHHRCISEELYNAAGQLASRTVFEYDASGQVIREFNYNFDPLYSHADTNKVHRYEYGYYEG
jgi:hypothetical protein